MNGIFAEKLRKSEYSTSFSGDKGVLYKQTTKFGQAVAKNCVTYFSSTP